MTHVRIITKYDGFEFKNDDFVKYLKRDLTLLIVYYLSDTYTSRFREFGILPLDEIVNDSSNGILYVTRPEKSFERSLNSLQGILRKNPKKILDIFSRAERTTKRTEAFCKRDIKKGLAKKQRLSFLNKFYRIMTEYGHYYMFTVFFGYSSKEDVLKKYPAITRKYEGLKQGNLFKALEDVYTRFGQSFLGKDGKFVTYLTVEEFREMIKKDKIDIQLAKDRYKRFFLYATGTKKYVLTNKEVDKVYKKFEENLKKSHVSGTGEVKGTPAYMGKTEGIAFVAVNQEDYMNIKEDCVLITAMTTPWMTPYLKKIKGIITDEGGLGTHAAILAREMKVPCIIGTRNATSVFKTGDKVELDSHKGIARKVK